MILANAGRIADWQLNWANLVDVGMNDFLLARPSVIFKVSFSFGYFASTGESPGNLPCTHAKVTLVPRSHTQQNKGKQVSFS